MDRLLNETSASDSEADAGGVVTVTRMRIRRPSASALKAVAADMRSPREVLAVQALPALASQLSQLQYTPPTVRTSSAVTSPSTTAPSSLSAGLTTLSHAVGATPRLPPITLLTTAASTLPPVNAQHFQQQYQQQQQPLLLQPRPVATTASFAPTNTPLNHMNTAGGTSVTAEQVPDALLCRYRNKKCGLPRAIKRNGDRHNLCEKHRAKANQNQRKLESKRRQQKRLLARAAQQGQCGGSAHQLEGGADAILAIKKEAVGIKMETPKLYREYSPY